VHAPSSAGVTCQVVAARCAYEFVNAAVDARRGGWEWCRGGITKSSAVFLSCGAGVRSYLLDEEMERRSRVKGSDAKWRACWREVLLAVAIVADVDRNAFCG
jgi:hypothetical protein